MKVLVVLHGMPPQAGRSAVGSGQRAFANGEGLRLRGHQVFYCTRTEDLPEQLRERAEARRDRDPVRLTLTGDEPPPGAVPRKRMPLGMAIGASPEDGRSDDPLASIDWSEAWGMGSGESTAVPRRSNWTPDVGLAPTGGPAGAPGNPFNFTESHELHDVIRTVDPDVVLLEAMEEARRLPDGRFAVVIDAFAPRVLEQQFQSGADQREAILVLDALQRADHFIYSNERQKYFHLPLLALAGVDCTQNAGDVVRISCPPDLPPVQKPRDPIFVAGGVFWPWADLSTGLGSLLSILETRSAGNIHLYGGEYALRSDTTEYADPRETLPRDHARLQFKGMVPVDELWDDYRNATVAFDLMAPNPEREINLSFRQIDYLRCGLPIITAPRQVIAADLLEYGAGWTVEPGDTEALRDLVDRLIDNPDEVAVASAAAQKLARERYAWDVTTAPLDAFIRQPRRRQSRETVVGRIARTQAELWDEHRAAKRLRDKVLDLQDELEKKSEEVGQVNARMRELITSVDRLSGSLQEVSRFKSDTLRYLHEEQDATVKDIAEAERELERRALDLRKKQDALDKAHSEIDKLKQSLGELRTDAEGTEARFIARDRAASELEAERRDLSRTISELRRESADHKREASSKSSALGELRSALQRLEARYIDRLGEAESSARELLNQATERVSEAVLARGRATTDLADTRGRLITAEGDLAKKTAELKDVQERARKGAAKHETLLHAHEAARARQAELQAEVDNARAESEKRRSEVEAVRNRMRLQAKDSHASLEASEARWLERFERAESEARQVLSEAMKRAGTVETARSQLQSKLSDARERLTMTAGDLAKKTAELKDVQERAREGAAKHETLLHAHEAARARQAELQAEVGNARAESEKRRSEVEAVRTRMRLQAKDSHASLEASEARWLERFERAESEARQVLSEAMKRAGTVETARSQLQSNLSDARERLTMTAGELDKKNVELEDVQERARKGAAKHETLLHAHEAARARQAELQAEVGNARAEAEKRRSEVEAVRNRMRLQAKDSHASLEASEARWLERFERAESEARQVLSEAMKRAGTVETARSQLQSKLSDARERLTMTAGDLAKKTAELKDVQERAREGAAKHETLLHAHEAARARQAELQAEVGNARAESEKRRSEVEAVRTRMRLQAKDSHASLEASEARWLERFERAESEARQVLSEAMKRAGTVETARSQLQSKLSDARERLTMTAGDLAKKTAELKDVQERAREGAAKHETLLHAHEAARARQAELQAEVGNARAESEKRRSEVEAVRTRMRLQAKDSHASLEASEARWLERFERAESEARQVLSEGMKRAGTVETARSQLQSKLSDARERLTMTAGELDKKNVELSELQRRGREESARLVTENAAQTARLVAKQNAETDLIHASQRDALDLLIAEARDNSARTQREHQAEAARVQTDHQAEAARVQADHQAVVARLQSERQTEFALALDEHRADISRLQQDRKDEVTRLQAERQTEFALALDEHRADISRLQQDRKDEVTRLQAERQTEFALALDEHRADISRLQEDRKDEVARVQSATKAEFVRLEEEQRSEIARLLREHQSESERERASEAGNVDRLRGEQAAEIDRLQAQHRTQLDRVETRAIEAGAQADALAHELAETATEALQGKSRLSDALGDVRKKAAEVEALRRRLAEERVQSMAALDTAEERALSDVQRARMDAEAHLSSLRTETESRLQSLQTRSERQVRQLQQESTARTLATEERLREISLERADLADRLERAEYGLGALRTSQKKTAKLLATAQEQRDATQKELDESRRAYAVATDDAAEKTAKLLATAQEQRDAMQKELDASRRAYTVATDDAAKKTAELGGRVEELDFEVASLRTSQKKTAKLLTTAQEQRAATQKELDESRRAYAVATDDAAEKTAELGGRVEELDFEVASLRTSQKKTAKLLTTAQEQRDATQKELDESRRAYAVATDDTAEKTAKLLTTAQEQRDATQKELDESRRAYTIATDDAAKKIAQLGGRVEELDFEVASLRTDLTAKVTELESAYAARDAVQKEMATVHQAANRRAKRADKDLEKSARQIEELQFEVEAASKEALKKAAEIDTLRNETDNRMKAVTSEFAFEELSLKTDLQKKSVEVDSLLNQRTSLQSEMSQLEAERLRLDTTVRKLDTEVGTLREQLAAAAASALTKAAKMAATKRKKPPKTKDGDDLKAAGSEEKKTEVKGSGVGARLLRRL